MCVIHYFQHKLHTNCSVNYYKKDHFMCVTTQYFKFIFISSATQSGKAEVFSQDDLELYGMMSRPTLTENITYYLTFHFW